MFLTSRKPPSESGTFGSPKSPSSPNLFLKSLRISVWFNMPTSGRPSGFWNSPVKRNALLGLACAANLPFGISPLTPSTAFIFIKPTRSCCALKAMRSSYGLKILTSIPGTLRKPSRNAPPK